MVYAADVPYAASPPKSCPWLIIARPTASTGKAFGSFSSPATSFFFDTALTYISDTAKILKMPHPKAPIFSDTVHQAP